MKNVVIIDDNEYKRETIREYIEKIFPDANIKEIEAINPALRFLVVENEDNIKNNSKDWLIITDMVMPRYVGKMPERYAGFDILRELQRKHFECPAIVQSSDELNLEECKSKYKNLLGAVKESPVVYNLSKYKELLKEYIK